MMMADDGRINHSKSMGIVRNDVTRSWEGGGARFNVGGLIKHLELILLVRGVCDNSV